MVRKRVSNSEPRSGFTRMEKYVDLILSLSWVLRAWEFGHRREGSGTRLAQVVTSLGPEMDGNENGSGVDAAGTQGTRHSLSLHLMLTGLCTPVDNPC